MSHIPGKVEGNVRARFESGKSTVSREVGIVKTFASDLLGLKPVKAVVDVTVDTLDNVGDFLKKQAEITRSWAQI